MKFNEIIFDERNREFKVSLSYVDEEGAKLEPFYKEKTTT